MSEPPADHRTEPLAPPLEGEAQTPPKSERPRSLEEAILTELWKKCAGGSINPVDAARAFDPHTYRKRLRHVRAAAVTLARRGEVVIIRKGKRADPNSFKGVYRIRPPAPDEAGEGSDD